MRRRRGGKPGHRRGATGVSASRDDPRRSVARPTGDPQRDAAPCRPSSPPPCGAAPRGDPGPTVSCQATPPYRPSASSLRLASRSDSKCTASHSTDPATAMPCEPMLRTASSPRQLRRNDSDCRRALRARVESDSDQKVPMIWSRDSDPPRCDINTYRSIATPFGWLSNRSFGSFRPDEGEAPERDYGGQLRLDRMSLDQDVGGTGRGANASEGKDLDRDNCHLRDYAAARCSDGHLAAEYSRAKDDKMSGNSRITPRL